MGSHVIDLLTLRNNFGTQEMRDIWTDHQRVQKQLDVERALALAEGKLGIIPQEAAERIAKVSNADNIDIQAIAEQAGLLKHSMMATINALQVLVGEYGEYVHFGATTQDIVDTGTMLQLQEAYQIIKRDVHEIIDLLAVVAKKYQHTVMVGRTHGMHALPITFGFKVAVWLDEFLRHAERLNEIEMRVFVGNINGAVGSYASFGPKGIEVEKEALDILGLETPNIGWQPARDRFSEYANVVALISGTLGKIGNEFYNLMRTDIGEIEEAFTPGKIGSSTMPHKRNPAAFEGLASLTPPILKSVSLIHESMHVEHERDAMSWRQEWIALPEMSIYLAAQLANLKSILGDFTVREDKMKENLEKQHGLLLSEKVMFELGKTLGKQTAHHLVYEQSMKSFEEQRNFAEVLLEKKEVSERYSIEEIETWLAPENYTGLCAEKVDQVIQKVEAFKNE